MTVTFSWAEFREFKSSVEKLNNKTAYVVFNSIFSKDRIPEVELYKDNEIVRVIIPQKYSLKFLKILSAHTGNVGKLMNNGFSLMSLSSWKSELKTFVRDVVKVFR